MQKAFGVRWDLSDLLSGVDDPALEGCIAQAAEEAEKFARAYRGRIASTDLTPARLLMAIHAYEALQKPAARPSWYAMLAFAADASDDRSKALVSRCQELEARITNTVLFFDLEIQDIGDEKFAEIMSSGVLERYRHWLENVRIFKPFVLSEKEEQVINQKDLSGKLAFVNYFDELTASMLWEFELDGERRRLTGEEMRHLLRRPEPEIRERAKRAYDNRYAENAITFTNVFNSIVKDHAIEMQMRRFGSPMAPSFLRNRVRREVVETMMEISGAHNWLLQEYYALKARLLDMPKLRGCDLVAPVTTKKREVLFDEGRELILDSFAAFDGNVADLAGQMFARKWIDAEVRPAKRGGAFCAATLPELHPYILMSYNDDFDNVYTLAHELGHAVHDFLAGRKQSLLNFHPPLVAAETASVFAEMLLTRWLLREFGDRETRIGILTSKLEDLLATIHVQNFYTCFELDAHQLGARQRLSAKDLCELWTKRRQETYGESVDFLPEQQWYWAAIPHFIHTRFYCYAYTFGALLVLALYRQYEQEGESFVPRYIELLEAGGSDKPENLIRRLGFDIAEAEFWKGGFDVIRDMMNELKALVAGSSEPPGSASANTGSSSQLAESSN